MPEVVRYHRLRFPGGPSGAATPYENLIIRDTALSPALGSSLWESCPLLAITSDALIGPHYFEDYLNQTITANTIGGYTFTAATSGGITLDTTNGNGVALLSAGAITSGQGVTWQMVASPFLVAANKPVWYETRVKFSGLLTTPKIQFFAGLAVQNTALIAAGAVAVTDMIGFAGVSTTGVVLATTASGAVATTATGLTFADATWYRLGIYATSTAVTFYVNGQPVAVITATIPTTQLAPAFVCQAFGTVTPVLNVDYLRVVGIR